MGDVTYIDEHHGSDSAEAYFAQHVANGADHVVFATAIREDGSEAHKVFSTLAKAKAWADRECGEDGSAIFVPYIIDVPEFGNVPASKQN